VRVERAVSRPAVRPAYDLRRLDDPWLALAGDAEGEDRLVHRRRRPGRAGCRGIRRLFLTVGSQVGIPFVVGTGPETGSAAGSFPKAWLYFVVLFCGRMARRSDHRSGGSPAPGRTWSWRTELAYHLPYGYIQYADLTLRARRGIVAYMASG
jgi:hypothetical protein